MAVTYTVSRNKLSGVAGHDSVSVTFSSSEDYRSFECRATKEGDPYGVGIGALLAAFSYTPAGVERTFEIYDDHLVNGDGIYRITLYVQTEATLKLPFELGGSEF